MLIDVINRKSQCNNCKEDKDKLLDIYIGEDKGSRFRIRLCENCSKSLTKSIIQSLAIIPCKIEEHDTVFTLNEFFEATLDEALTYDDGQGYYANLDLNERYHVSAPCLTDEVDIVKAKAIAESRGFTHVVWINK